MRKKEVVEKILDVDAAMQGSLVFKDPVNLRINGSFEGTLDTKGILTISESAVVKAEVRGESIIIAGQVHGDVIAERELRIIPPAHVTGNVTTPRLNILEGAVLDGECHMTMSSDHSSTKNIMTAEELAGYLEVDPSMIFEWVGLGKIPAFKDKDVWRFDRNRIDEWIANGKVM